MKTINNSLYLTFLSACDTITTCKGMSLSEYYMFVPYLAKAFTDILEIRTVDAEDFWVKPLCEMKAAIAEFLGEPLHENLDSRAWS